MRHFEHYRHHLRVQRRHWAALSSRLPRCPILRRVSIATALLIFVTLTAGAQGALSELLAGKLIDPEVGQWALYDLHDQDGQLVLGLRQAVVGEEKVGRKTGYWVELELVPKLGLRTIYRMLLTGPANDPKNVHQVWTKTELDEPQQLELDPESLKELAGGKKPKRKKIGEEIVETESGPVEAMHYRYSIDDEEVSLWHSDDALPTGLVRFQSKNGDVLLRSHGQGGQFGLSAMFPSEADAAEEPLTPGPLRVIVRTPDGERTETP